MMQSSNPKKASTCCHAECRKMQSRWGILKVFFARKALLRGQVHPCNEKEQLKKRELRKTPGNWSNTNPWYKNARKERKKMPPKKVKGKRERMSCELVHNRMAGAGDQINSAHFLLLLKQQDCDVSHCSYRSVSKDPHHPYVSFPDSKNLQNSWYFGLAAEARKSCYFVMGCDVNFAGGDGKG